MQLEHSFVVTHTNVVVNVTTLYHPTLLIPQIARQILEAHTSMLSLSVADAKLQYIRNWQALQDFGITYFVVKVGRNKKEVSPWHLNECISAL